jgi:drug/metabolite transporter (DMT)-like permease
LLKFMSILLTVVGAVVMLNPTNMALSAANLCFLARALCLAAYLSLQAPLLNHLSAITVTTIAQVLIRSHVAVNDTERALESLRIYCRRPG